MREPATSSTTWETLESFARAQVQGFIQQLLEDEVTELLGRPKSARRAALDAARGSRNGYGKPRKLALMNGTVTVRRPRVRDLEERFMSRLLPLFQRRTPEVSALLPELYLHGLALGFRIAVPKKREADVKAHLQQIANAETVRAATRLRDTFARAYRRALPKAVECLERDWDRLVAYYAFPQEHWKHLRTTNVIESPFAAVRLRTSAAKRFKRIDNATTLIWKPYSSSNRTSANSTHRTSAPPSSMESFSLTESEPLH